jgi:hypothetical protein
MGWTGWRIVFAVSPRETGPQSVYALYVILAERATGREALQVVDGVLGQAICLRWRRRGHWARGRCQEGASNEQDCSHGWTIGAGRPGAQAVAVRAMLQAVELTGYSLFYAFCITFSENSSQYRRFSSSDDFLRRAK